MSGLAAKFFALVNSVYCPPCTTPTPPAQDVDPHVWDDAPNVAKFNRLPVVDPYAGYFA